MNDKKQIEELASLMADCNTTCDECFEKFESVTTMKIKEREKHCQVYAYAQRAVEQGYRKIPEGAVVLTKEECDNKVILNEDHFERALNYEREKARKETAREILTELKNTRFHKGKLTYDFEMAVNRIAKQYGVEVEE